MLTDRPQSPVWPITQLEEDPDAGAQAAQTSFIDKNVIITGEVICDGELELQGQIQGQLRCKALAIVSPGSVTGDIIADSALINGRVDGTIRAKQLSLGRAATVFGDLHHTQISIDSGALFEGNVRRLEESTQVQPEVLYSQDPAMANHQAPDNAGLTLDDLPAAQDVQNALQQQPGQLTTLRPVTPRTGDTGR